MHLPFQDFILIVDHETKKKLAKTCFRDVAQPGTFLHWENVQDIFYDQQVQQELIKEVETSIKEGSGVYSFSIDCHENIGLTSTILIEKATGPLVKKPLNGKAEGMFVKMAAPLTSMLTVIYRLQLKKPRATVEILSIYPGIDVGVLEGDVSEREGVVFLDWIPLHNPRIVDRWEPEDKRRKKITTCEEPMANGKLCGEKTKEGKDRCIEHSAYAQKLKLKQQEIESLDEQARMGKKIDINSPNIRDLFLALRLQGPRTVERLAKEMNKDIEVIEGYLKALKKTGLIKFGKTKRGSTTVSLASPKKR